MAEQSASKKTSPVLFILVIIGIILIACVWTAVSHPELFSGSKNSTVPKEYQIKYSVTGSASHASLTYENATGGTEQIDGARVPWQLEFTIPRGQRSFLYISAQNQDNSGSSIVCEIWVDGVPVKSATSSGAYVIATCSGSIQ
jgi:hypothetical protein